MHTKLKPYHRKYRDEEKNETVFEIHFQDSFVRCVKNWKFTTILEIVSALADPEDFIQ